MQAKRDERIPSGLASSSLSLKDLVLLKRMLLFSTEDERYLKMAGEILTHQAEAILDTWYDHILSNDYLAHYFTKDGQPDAQYLDSLRPRFGDWIRQLCQRPSNTQWQPYEAAIAKRYSGDQQLPLAEMKEVPVVFLRYLITFIYPVTAYIAPFLAKHGHSAAEVDKMRQAWFKAVSLSVLLWTYPGAEVPATA